MTLAMKLLENAEKANIIIYTSYKIITKKRNQTYEATY